MYTKDRTGERRGKLVCIGYAGQGTDLRRRHMWRYRCDCGNEVTLIPGRTRSCGCTKVEHLKTVVSHINTTHGKAARLTRTRTYGIWVGMRSRCNNPNAANYKHYGGRGIRVCERWNSYTCFLEDMGEAPDGMRIERKNNDGDYDPGNCVWATETEQQNNKRTNTMVHWRGRNRSLANAARSAGIPYATLLGRIRIGHSVLSALSMPYMSKGR